MGDGRDLTDGEARLTDLEAQVADLLGVVAEQRARIGALEGHLALQPDGPVPAEGSHPHPAPEPVDRSMGRRRLLLGGATTAAATAAAVVTSASPAAAANNNPLVMGVTTNTATLTTKLTSSDANGQPGLNVQHTGTGAAVNGGAANATGYGAVGTNTTGVGVYGRSDEESGVYGQSTSGYGVQATSQTSFGVYATSDSQIGVYGSSRTKEGVYGYSDTLAGVSGFSPTYQGVLGSSISGTGVWGEGGDGFGLVGIGDLAAVALRPHTGARPAPTGDAVGHSPGDLVMDGSGVLWLCTVAGTPGTFRRVGGPASAGAFHVLPAPVRVYDSRPLTLPNVGSKTPLAANVSRVLDTTANSSGVPSDATAVLATLLLVNAFNGNGNLTIWANGVTKPLSNTIVWGAGAGRWTASAVTALGAGGNVQVQASVATDLVLDIVGYYR